MAKEFGTWGTVASFQLGGVIGCGLAFIGIIFLGWAPLVGLGIAMVTGAVAGVFINALDKAQSDLGNHIAKATVQTKEASMPYRAAKKGTDFMKTTAGKVATGAAVVTLAGSMVVSGGNDSTNSDGGGSGSRNTGSDAPHATLTVQGNTVTRTEVQNIENCDRSVNSDETNIHWEIRYSDGGHLLSRTANNEYELVFDEDSSAFNRIMLGNIQERDGYAEVWLECWIGGGYQPISNTVQVYP